MPTSQDHHHPLPHAAGVRSSSFSQLLSQFTSPLQVHRPRPCLFGTRSWRLDFAGGTGSTACCEIPRPFFPTPASRPFIPGPPHWSPRLLSCVHSHAHLTSWTCRSQRKRGTTEYVSVETTRPRNAANSARLILIRERGRGVDGGCDRVCRMQTGL
jgi:hypothetical protein